MKRKTFIIEYEIDGRIEKVRYLAYSQNGRMSEHELAYAREQIEARRGRITSYYEKPRANAVKKAGAGWEIDERALREARQELGLKWPVYVRGMSGARVRGKYRLRHRSEAPAKSGIRGQGSYHAITVSVNLTPEEASSTLWHELTHAMQAERCGDPFAWAAFTRQQARFSYERRPIEVEARMMQKQKSHIQLTR